MVGFKKFCLIFSSLSIATTILILLAPWVDIAPYNTYIVNYIAFSSWFFFLIEFLAVISLFSALCIFIMGVAKRKHKDLYVDTEQGARITISRTAIASQVTYIAEYTADVTVEKVQVRVKNHSKIFLYVAVQPNVPMSIPQVGKRIETAIRESLAWMLDVDDVTIALRFVEASHMEDVSNVEIPQEKQDITVDIEAASAEQPKK